MSVFSDLEGLISDAQDPLDKFTTAVGELGLTDEAGEPQSLEASIRAILEEILPGILAEMEGSPKLGASKVENQKSAKTEGKSPSGAMSQNQAGAEIDENTSNADSFELEVMKNELAAMDKKLLVLMMQIDKQQDIVKSLAGMGKQLMSLEAKVNQLLSKDSLSSNPCDTPEGLSGEIAGCY